MPNGCSDDEFPWVRSSEDGDELKTKYPYSVHSELNAILNYRGPGLEGARLYVTLFPCNECAKAVIQSGIRTVIYGDDKYRDAPNNIASLECSTLRACDCVRYQPTGRKIEIEL